MNPEWLVFLVPPAMTLYVWKTETGKLWLVELCATFAVAAGALYFTYVSIASSIEDEIELRVERVVQATSQEVAGGMAPKAYTLSGEHKSVMQVEEPVYRELEVAWGEQSVSDGRETLRWPGTVETTRFMAYSRPYWNWLRATRKAYRFPQVNEKLFARYRLHRYPLDENPLSTEMIVGPTANALENRSEAEFKLKTLNATEGHIKGYQAWILLFPGQPPEAAEFQEALWRGGRPNDFVVCLGLDANNAILWSHAFSWAADQTSIKEVERWADSGTTLDLVASVDQLNTLLSNWKPLTRSRFTLGVEVPYFTIAMIAVVTVVAGIVAVLIAKDDGNCP